MDYKKRLVIFGLAILFFILLIIIALVLLLSPKTQISQLPTGQTTETIRDQTTPAIKNPSQKSLRVLYVNPPQNESFENLPIIKIEFTFNTLINPKTFFYTITPKTETYLTTKGNTLTIFPKLMWNPGITTVTILPDTKAADGAQLRSSYIYKFTTKVPEDPPEYLEDL